LPINKSILQVLAILQYHSLRLKLPKYHRKNFAIPQTTMSPSDSPDIVSDFIKCIFAFSTARPL